MTTPVAQKPGPVRDDDDTVRKIPLRNKKREVVAYAYVDAVDFEAVNAYGKWHRRVTENNTYANGSMLMHTFILGQPPEDMVIDHWNGDGLDNRRCNLRFACRSVNSHNRKKRAGTSSRFKGVSKDGSLWSAELKGRKMGRFKDEVHAAYMYDLAAIEEYGEHANINGVRKPADWKLPVKRPRAPKEKVSVKVDKDISDVTRTDDGHAYVMAKNERILVSDSDWPVVAKYTWYLGHYAATRIDGKPVRMHKLLMGDKRGYIVDHINNNRYDNRRCNLRWATSSENKHNVVPRNGKLYKGTMRDGNKYSAQLKCNRKRYTLGNYPTEVLAALAYNYAASHFYGEDAYQNDVPDDPGYAWDLEKLRLVPRTAA